MTQTAQPPALPHAPSGTLIEHQLHGWLMHALGLLLAAAAFLDFRLGQEFDFLRTPCLVAEIVAGTGIAFCFGGAMHYLDRSLASTTRRGTRLAWYWRALLLAQKRLLLLGQLAAMALVVASLGAFIFDKPIPGPDRSVLEPGWTPPASVPYVE